MSSSTPISGTGIPIRSALKSEDDGGRETPPGSASMKAVQIAEPPSASPGPITTPKHHQYPATSARRLSGRPALPGASSSRNSLISQNSLENLSSSLATPPTGAEDAGQSSRRHRLSEKLIGQVAEWLEREKTKKENRKARKVPSRRKSKSPPTVQGDATPGTATPQQARSRAASVSSNSSDVSLDRLQRILDDSLVALGVNNTPRLGRKSSKRNLSHRSLNKVASSDTEYHDNNDILVPSCDGFLDNSKSLSYTGGKSTDDGTSSISSKREDKEKAAWLTFKNEIIRLAHTLRLKGWRRVPLDSGETITVERLSGALTNAVYVVEPPKDLPVEEGKKAPTKVLLRIYGPQVDIDRENELSMLRRLARKKIGPRLLGTFLNGRFEQYFNAATLTPANLREPETSKQIAKRMRELHDGIDLLDDERVEGPSVWKNWDRWLDQAEQRVKLLDRQILEAGGRRGSIRSAADAWKARGLVCGAEWATFKAAVDKYRKFLEEYYGGQQKIREQLVFAHNDTQYGNILRIRPDDEKSPLLQPANEHKQLIVIDFEYAGANTRGLEFANHFTEWSYNYHDATAPYACNTTAYPTPEQQHRFLRAYVDHHPRRNSLSSSSSSASGTATPAPERGQLHSTPSASSIVDFMLDARVPAHGWKEEETKREEEVERRVKELMEETRLWRVANSAHWIAWGVVQAKIPGLGGGEEPLEGDGEVIEGPEGEVPDEEEEFDYLGYAQERAMFFWGDCVLLGIVKEEELSEGLRGRLKFVRY